MSAALTHFLAFYTARQPKRTLSWIQSLSTCVLRANFPKPGKEGGGTKEVHVSLWQTLVLMLFNDEGQRAVGWAEIKERSGIGTLTSSLRL